MDGVQLCCGTVDKLYHPKNNLYRDACALITIDLISSIGVFRGEGTGVPSKQRKKEKAKSHRLQAGASDEAARDLLQQCHAPAFRGLRWFPRRFSDCERRRH